MQIKNWLTTIWKDPVWSKVIAVGIIFLAGIIIKESETLWVKIILAVIFILTFISWLRYSQYASIKYQKILFFLSKNRQITYGQIIVGVIIIFILPYLLKGLFVVFFTSKYEHHYQYLLTNQNNEKKENSIPIHTERSFNILKIKPIGETKDWYLGVFFSHIGSRNEVENNFEDCPSIILRKRYGEKNLNLIISEEPEDLVIFENYTNQVIEIFTEYKYDRGGTIVQLKRNDEVLYESENMFGFNKIFLTAWSDNQDFKIEVNHDRFE